MRSLPATFALGALLLAGCQDPDVGGPCHIDLPGLVDSAVAADFLETGVTGCDNLVCIKSPPPPAGSRRTSDKPYCSKPCVATNDCSASDTGLECRDVVLDETFLNSLPPDVRAKYLPQFQNAKYCAAPLPR